MGKKIENIQASEKGDVMTISPNPNQEYDIDPRHPDGVTILARRAELFGQVNKKYWDFLKPYTVAGERIDKFSVSFSKSNNGSLVVQATTVNLVEKEKTTYSEGYSLDDFSNPQPIKNSTVSKTTAYPRKPEELQAELETILAVSNEKPEDREFIQELQDSQLFYSFTVRAGIWGNLGLTFDKFEWVWKALFTRRERKKMMKSYHSEEIVTEETKAESTVEATVEATPDITVASPKVKSANQLPEDFDIPTVFTVVKAAV